MDYAQVGDDREEIDDKLLRDVQSLDIDAASALASPRGPRIVWLTFVFSPDSVQPLAPKKSASIARRLPKG